jgi:hypothetical protein
MSDFFDDDDAEYWRQETEDRRQKTEDRKKAAVSDLGN